MKTTWRAAAATPRVAVGQDPAVNVNPRAGSESTAAGHGDATPVVTAPGAQRAAMRAGVHGGSKVRFTSTFWTPGTASTTRRTQSAITS